MNPIEIEFERKRIAKRQSSDSSTIVSVETRSRLHDFRSRAQPTPPQSAHNECVRVGVCAAARALRAQRRAAVAPRAARRAAVRAAAARRAALRAAARRRRRAAATAGPPQNAKQNTKHKKKAKTKKVHRRGSSLSARLQSYAAWLAPRDGAPPALVARALRSALAHWPRGTARRVALVRAWAVAGSGGLTRAQVAWEYEELVLQGGGIGTAFTALARALARRGSACACVARAWPGATLTGARRHNVTVLVNRAEPLEAGGDVLGSPHRARSFADWYAHPPVPF